MLLIVDICYFSGLGNELTLPQDTNPATATQEGPSTLAGAVYPGKLHIC